MCTKNLTTIEYLPWYAYKEGAWERLRYRNPQNPPYSTYHSVPLTTTPTPTLHTHNSLLTISQNQPFQHYLPFYNPLHTHLLLEDMIIHLSCELSPKTLRLELLHNTSHMTQRPPNRLIPTPNLFVIQLGLRLPPHHQT